MPTKRWGVSTLCIETTLIVVGGKKGDDVFLNTVEILGTSTRQWHTATKLPQPLANSSMTVCGDHIDLLGAAGEHSNQSTAIYCIHSSCQWAVVLQEFYHDPVLTTHGPEWRIYQ